MKMKWLLLTLSLSGCTNAYKSEFDCAPDKGLSCTSVSKVNELIDKNKIEKRTSREEGTRDTKEPSSEVQTSLEPFGKRGVVRPGVMRRVPEKIIRVWVAGYETPQGDFYEPHFVNLVVDQGHWVNGGTR